MTWTSTASLDEIANRIAAATSIVCLTHARPDGDAIGSVLALVRALATETRQVQGWLIGPVPQPLKQLIGDAPVKVLDPAPELDKADGLLDPDLVIVADTGAWSQVQELEPMVRARHKNVIVLDHHASGDTDMSDCRLIDASAASATVIVLRVLEHIGADLGHGDESVAEALFAGLATDTGWFRQANANAEAFAVAATLLAKGVDKNRLYRMIEETARPQRLALQARLLASVQWVAGGRGAIMQLAADDFTETGGRRDELTGLVNAPLVVGGVEFSVLLTEDPPHAVKISMRSKSPRSRDGAWVNVRDIASHLGGGGHLHASGARVEGDLALACQRVLEAVVASGYEA